MKTKEITVETQGKKRQQNGFDPVCNTSDYEKRSLLHLTSTEMQADDTPPTKRQRLLASIK